MINTRMYRINRNQDLVLVTKIGQDNKPYLLNVPYSVYRNVQEQQKNNLIDQLLPYKDLLGEINVLKTMIVQNVEKDELLKYIEGIEKRMQGKDLISIVNNVDILQSCEDYLFTQQE